MLLRLTLFSLKGSITNLPTQFDCSYVWLQGSVLLEPMSFSLLIGVRQL